MEQFNIRKHIQQILSEGKDAQIKAEAAREYLGIVLLDTLRRAVPVGTIIHLSQDKKNLQPAYLSGLTVISGDSGGAESFRALNVRGVTIDLKCPEYSEWQLEVVPIRVGHSHLQAVLLQGRIARDPFDPGEDGPLTAWTNLLETNT